MTLVRAVVAVPMGATVNVFGVVTAAFVVAIVPPVGAAPVPVRMTS
jgi:hypothetical protein